jgi:hypothetical protein
MTEVKTPRYNKDVCEATGKGWEEWFALLEQKGAREMSHAEINRWLGDVHELAFEHCNWVTTAYERHIGRLVVGQDCYGNFYATASKGVAGDLDFALDAWLRRVNGATEFNGLSLAGEPKVSSTEKFRYWRATFTDGGTINIVISIKGPGKSTVAVDHRKLADEAAVKEWKEYWKGFLAGM